MQPSSESPATPAELYPGHAADLAQQAARDARKAAANATPIPGALREAFLPPVGPVTFVPITCGHIAILQVIKSPILDLAVIYTQERDKKTRDEKIAAMNFPDDAGAEMVYIFSHTPPELRALLHKGRDAFRETACTEVLDKLPPGGLLPLALSASQHFNACCATAVDYGPEQKDGSFPGPAEAVAGTASAGGSTSTHS